MYATIPTWYTGQVAFKRYITARTTMFNWSPCIILRVRQKDYKIIKNLKIMPYVRATCPNFGFGIL